MPIVKIISGGQTGADQAGLKAAKHLVIITGGCAPRDYRTDTGNNPGLLKDTYKLAEHSSYDYPPRTRLNIEEADGTIIFAFNTRSPGTRLTIKICYNLAKPCYLVDLNIPVNIKLIINWLKKHDIEVLNVAGNRERSHPGIHDETLNYMFELLSEYNGRKN